MTKGYDYIPEAGLSVQGQDANAAWRGVVDYLAQNLRVPVEGFILVAQQRGCRRASR